MNVYKQELGRLQKLKKIYKKLEPYKFLTLKEKQKFYRAFEKLSKIPNDISGFYCKKLFKKYHIYGNHWYRDILSIYAFHSKEMPWIVRKTLSLEQYQKLIEEFEIVKELEKQIIKKGVIL